MCSIEYLSKKSTIQAEIRRCQLESLDIQKYYVKLLQEHTKSKERRLQNKNPATNAYPLSRDIKEAQARNKELLDRMLNNELRMDRALQDQHPRLRELKSNYYRSLKLTPESNIQPDLQGRPIREEPLSHRSIDPYTPTVNEPQTYNVAAGQSASPHSGASSGLVGKSVHPQTGTFFGLGGQSASAQGGASLGFDISESSHFDLTDQTAPSQIAARRFYDQLEPGFVVQSEPRSGFVIQSESTTGMVLQSQPHRAEMVVQPLSPHMNFLNIYDEEEEQGEIEVPVPRITPRVRDSRSRAPSPAISPRVRESRMRMSQSPRQSASRSSSDLSFPEFVQLVEAVTARQETWPESALVTALDNEGEDEAQTASNAGGGVGLAEMVPLLLRWLGPVCRRIDLDFDSVLNKDFWQRIDTTGNALMGKQLVQHIKDLTGNGELTELLVDKLLELLSRLGLEPIPIRLAMVQTMVPMLAPSRSGDEWAVSVLMKIMELAPNEMVFLPVPPVKSGVHSATTGASEFSDEDESFSISSLSERPPLVSVNPTINVGSVPGYKELREKLVGGKPKKQLPVADVDDDPNEELETLMLPRSTSNVTITAKKLADSIRNIDDEFSSLAVPAHNTIVLADEHDDDFDFYQ